MRVSRPSRKQVPAYASLPCRCSLLSRQACERRATPQRPDILCRRQRARLGSPAHVSIFMLPPWYEHVRSLLQTRRRCAPSGALLLQSTIVAANTVQTGWPFASLALSKRIASPARLPGNQAQQASTLAVAAVSSLPPRCHPQGNITILEHHSSLTFPTD